jgi:tetratricopeptide (TPR) repeat protein
VHNLRLWLWPHSSFGVLLSQTSALSPAVSIVTWLSALLCAWLLWKLSRHDEFVALALAWVLLFLLPLVNLLPIGNTPVALHYLIIPGVGMAWLVSRAITALARNSLRLMASLALALLLSWQPAFRKSIHAYESAVSLYETTLSNYPHNLEARVNLIAAYQDAGQLAKARELLDSSLRLAPGHLGLLKSHLSMLFREQRFSEAVAWLDRHAELTRADPELGLRRALALQQLGRAHEAEQLFERITSEHTAPALHLIAGYQLAMLWVQARRLPEAQALLRSLHAEFPDNVDVSLALRLIDQALAR